MYPTTNDLSPGGDQSNKNILILSLGKEVQLSWDDVLYIVHYTSSSLQSRGK